MHTLQPLCRILVVMRIRIRQLFGFQHGMESHVEPISRIAIPPNQLWIIVHYVPHVNVMVVHANRTIIT